MEHRCPDSLSRTHVPHPQAPGCRSPSRSRPAFGGTLLGNCSNATFSRITSPPPSPSKARSHHADYRQAKHCSWTRIPALRAVCPLPFESARPFPRPGSPFSPRLPPPAEGRAPAPRQTQPGLCRDTAAAASPLPHPAQPDRSPAVGRPAAAGIGVGRGIARLTTTCAPGSLRGLGLMSGDTM